MDDNKYNNQWEYHLEHLTSDMDAFWRKCMPPNPVKTSQQSDGHHRFVPASEQDILFTINRCKWNKTHFIQCLSSLEITNFVNIEIHFVTKGLISADVLFTTQNYN